MQTTPIMKKTGILFLSGAIALLIPYTILTIVFEYPQILRQDTGIILTKFHRGGARLIFTWFAFAMTGLPLIPAYIMLGQALEKKNPLMRTATAVGVTGLVVQMIGLLRWAFVVPILADTYINAADAATRSAAVITFNTVHQFGGVLLGEHLGQLFTIAWTVMVTAAAARQWLVPRWINVLGIVSAVVYLMAQADLFATVIPGFPVWPMAGFIGSTLWLLWLMIIGICFIRTKTSN